MAPPIGKLTVSIHLTKTQIHGPSDPVTGTIRITYHAHPSKRGRLLDPSSNSGETIDEQRRQLFGPLSLSLTLQGTLTLRVLENRTSHAYIPFHEDRLLFQRKTAVFTGPIRLSPDETRDYDFASFLPRQQPPLPPTFETRFQAPAARQAGKHQGAARVAYSVRPGAEMAGLDVEVALVPAAGAAVEFRQESEPGSAGVVAQREFTHSCLVSSYALLLPLEQRPRRSSLLDRTWTAVRGTARPSFAFEVSCAGIPGVVGVSGEMRFSVRMQCEPGREREVELDGGGSGVEIVARTRLSATDGKKGVESPVVEHEGSSSGSGSAGFCTRVGIARQEPEGPFGKASDYTKVVTTAAVPEGLASSFAWGRKLERSYKMRIRLCFVVAGQKAVVTREYPVKILSGSAPVGEGLLPPGSASRPFAVDESTIAGSSRTGMGQAWRHEREDEPLPAYEQVA